MRFNLSTIMAGVVRRDVGLYKHVTGCDYTCSLGRRPRENEKESEAHEAPPFREGRRQRRSSVFG